MGDPLSVRYLSVIYMFLVVHGEDVPTWEADDFCGFTVSRYDTTGILKLDVSNLRKGGSGAKSCKVTVSPASLPGSGSNGKVLFYFTEFDFSDPCSDFNISLVDGSSSYSPNVKGSPPALCSYNSTLTRPETVFNTSGTEFVVLIRWIASRARDTGVFQLNFASYYEGPCSDDTQTITCQNSRCTASAYHCHADINTCGTAEETVCKGIKEEALGFWENLKENLASSLKDFGIVVAVVIGVYFFFKLFKEFRQRYFSNSNTRNTQSVELSARSPSYTTLELNQQTSLVETPDYIPNDIRRDSIQSDSSIDTMESRELRDSALPPSYDTLSPAPTEPPPSVTPSVLPSAPPPSYDEFISNTDVYKE